MDFDPQDCTQAPAARTVGRTVTDDPAADCVMVLNRDGVVVGVNRPGLQLMGADEAALRGRPWVEALPAEARPVAQAALAEALEGKPARFSASDGRGGTWRARLDRLEGGPHVLVMAQPEADAAADAALAEALHDLANAVTEMQGAARILRRGPAPEMLPELAGQITGIGDRAEAALVVLRNSPRLRR